jgi:hypothetical protein
MKEEIRKQVMKVFNQEDSVDNVVNNILRIHDIVGRIEQCAHPRDKREYIGLNMLRCKVCGKEFS